MNSSIILQRLIDIEQSIGVETDSTVRRKVVDAQECLLRMEGEQVANFGLRLESSDSQSLALLRALQDFPEEQA